MRSMGNGGKRKRQRRKAQYLHEKAQKAQKQQKQPEKWVILNVDEERELIKRMSHCLIH